MGWRQGWTFYPANRNKPVIHEDPKLNQPDDQNIKELWAKVTSDNIDEETDFQGYQENFLKLFGFGLEGVDYEIETDPEVDIPSVDSV